MFEELGAALWAERARTELAQAGTREATGGLTAAEMRVVEQAARGRWNKEIAAALFVSVPTVELHLTHSYSKLGVRSRGQLTARLVAGS